MLMLRNGGKFLKKDNTFDESKVLNSIESMIEDGADFIDVKPKKIEVPTDNKRNRFGFMVGLGSGLYNVSGSFKPGWGVGVMLGYKLF